MKITEKERLDIIAGRIAESGIDLTANQRDWTLVAYACASQGEDGREAFHLISSNYPNYSREDCDRHFDYCLKTTKNHITMGTIIQWAKDHGIDTSMPKEETKKRRGRPPKTDEEREEEKKSLFERIREAVNERYEFRYNSLSERVEMQPREEEWRDLDDREFNGILTELHSLNIHVSKDNLATYINSGAFSTPYNPVVTYVESLKPWNRRTDYITKMFSYLKLEEGADSEFLVEAAKLWFVCFVASAAGLDVVNQLMLVLAGEKEGTGKTEFVRRLLPEPLRKYLHAATQLSNFRDKDESLATAHSILFFLDEILLNRQNYNKLKNMVGGAGAQVVTDRSPYAREAKVRKVHASLVATTNHLDFIPEDFGSRRLVVFPVIGSDNYDNLPVERAFAQAYYLATHPRRFSTKITSEMIQKLKETNRKYVTEDFCTTVIPSVLRTPKTAEQAQAVYSPEIIAWLISRFGPNKEFTPQKVNRAMRNLGFEPKDTKKGLRYMVVRITTGDLEQENKLLANEAVELDVPF